MQFFCASVGISVCVQFVFVYFVCPVIVIERWSCCVFLDANDIIIRLEPELMAIKFFV